jgi:hypothetical protein
MSAADCLVLLKNGFVVKIVVHQPMEKKMLVQVFRKKRRILQLTLQVEGREYYESFWNAAEGYAFPSKRLFYIFLCSLQVPNVYSQVTRSLTVNHLYRLHDFCRTVKQKMNKYAVVEFVKDKNMETIPSRWLRNDNLVAYWPPVKTTLHFRTYVTDCTEPEQTKWALASVRMLQTAGEIFLIFCTFLHIDINCKA